MAWRFRFDHWTSLHWALAFSVGVHLVLLAWRFGAPAAFERAFTDTALEVVLVNARSREEPPVKAQAIAQTTLAGGGDADKGMASSPLPASNALEIGDFTENTRKRLDRLQEYQQQLLAQVRREVALLPLSEPHQDNGSPSQREQEERRRQLLKLLASIEKRINEENSRPRKRYVSPATREEVYAQYADRLRRRIEDRGTRDFPEYQGRKLYGELTMNVTVDVEGRVVGAEVVKPSSTAFLDRRALAIVHAAAPFGRFTPGMRAQADQIVLTSRFRFTREDGVEASLSAAAR
jgi:protein TonB